MNRIVYLFEPRKLQLANATCFCRKGNDAKGLYDDRPDFKEEVPKPQAQPKRAKRIFFRTGNFFLVKSMNIDYRYMFF